MVIVEVWSFARPRVVIWDAVVGCGAISLPLLTLLSSGYDNITGVTADVDHVTEVAVGVVERVAGAFLVILGCAFAS